MQNVVDLQNYRPHDTVMVNDKNELGEEEIVGAVPWPTDLSRESIGIRLRAIRVVLGHDQTQFAKMLGWKVARYCHYENGRRELGNDAGIIARRFPVTTDWIFLGDLHGIKSPVLQEAIREYFAENFRPGRVIKP